jgi:hypothetical protein
MPAKPSKPATEVKQPAVKPAEKPVSKPTALPLPAKQDPAKLAKDLGAEKFLAKCLTSIKDVSQEDISKAVNEAWAKIANWKLQSAIAYVKARFAPTGMGNPEGSLIVGAGDAVDKDRNVLGATVYLLKDKNFINLKLLGKSVIEFDALGSGRSVVKLSAPKYTIDPASVESVPASDMDVYAALLNASVPKDQVPAHVFASYEIVSLEGKIRGFGADFTNPMATKTGDLKFTISPLAATEWDVAAWVHARKFGEAYLAMLGEAELNEYRKLDADGKAAFLDAMLRDQIVMVCGKVAKEPFKEYQGYKSLELDVITLMLRPDELDLVVFESRPARMAKPASSSDILSGTSIGNKLTVDEVIRQTGMSLTDILAQVKAKQADLKGLIDPEAGYVIVLADLGIDLQGKEVEYPDFTEQLPAGQPPTEQVQPVKLSKECLSKIALIKQLTGKPDDVIQNEAIDLQENIVTGGNPPLEFHELLDILIEKYQKPAKLALSPPAKEVDYTNPEDDTPALRQLRKAAVKVQWEGFTYEEFLAWAHQYSVKDVTAETLAKEAFTAFMTANKPAAK